MKIMKHNKNFGKCGDFRSTFHLTLCTTESMRVKFYLSFSLILQGMEKRNIARNKKERDICQVVTESRKKPPIRIGVATRV